MTVYHLLTPPGARKIPVTPVCWYCQHTSPMLLPRGSFAILECAASHEPVRWRQQTR